MTDQEINIAIAENSGWIKLMRGDYVPRSSTKEERLQKTYAIPDYVNDLNAMHEAEKTISLDERHKYQTWMSCLSDKQRRMAEIGWLNLTATARQRAEAFLRVKGLWKG